MAFSAITSEQIAAGEPTSQPLFQKIKDSLDDHESRLTVTEAALGRLPPIDFNVLGLLNAPLAMTGAMTYRIDQATTLTACRLLVVTAGSSGSVEIDVQYKRGAGAWTTVLTGPLSAGFASGSYFTANGTLAFQDLLPGDLLRLNINSVQVNMQDFSVFLERTAA